MSSVTSIYSYAFEYERESFVTGMADLKMRLRVISEMMDDLTRRIREADDTFRWEVRKVRRMSKQRRKELAELK